MNAAVYARKSTEQYGVADDQKSVTRQIDNAREYATRKGWTVNDERIFSTTASAVPSSRTGPGFIRLMHALKIKPRPAFQVVIMREESRLGREAIETAYALKQLVTSEFGCSSTWRTASAPPTRLPTR